MKSETCFEKMLDQYLPTSFIENDSDSVLYGLNKYDLERIVTQEKTKIQSKKHGCCMGSDREPKNIYSTKSEAYDAADFIYYERNIDLMVYKCRSGVGWHLTKKH